MLLNKTAIAAIENISEEELVSLLRNKDRKGLEWLYDGYAAAIYGVILRILKDECMAEEATQDCFIKIWNKIDTYDAARGRLFTWLINIARNHALDKLKSSEISRSRRTDPMDTYSENGNTDSINIETMGVQEMLRVLTREEKALIDLVYFEGYSHREIADEFNIPLGTVKTRIRSAINKLRMLF